MFKPFVAGQRAPGGPELREGIVIRATAGSCLVCRERATWHCKVRGRLKQGRRSVQNIVVAGDRVVFRDLGRPAAGDEHREGVVEEVLERRNRISRWAARRSGGRVEQVLMANLDQLVVVQSVAAPPPQGGLVDRLLAAAERYGVPGLLCLNKIDLDAAAAGDPRWDHYANIGYAVLRVSAITGAGCAGLAERLAGRVSLVLGASGVGKSSVLNRMEPGLDLRVGDVTEKTGLGRHTTTRTELYSLASGGYIADSPGLRGFDLWGVEPVEVRDYFPDFREPAARCRFRTCFHRDEPTCGVKEAVAAGVIPSWRYEAYLDLLANVEERAPGPEGRRA